jgi:uncharacterized membrane protein
MVDLVRPSLRIGTASRRELPVVADAVPVITANRRPQAVIRTHPTQAMAVRHPTGGLEFGASTFVQARRWDRTGPPGLRHQSNRKEKCAMATLVAIGYPDQSTAEQARVTVQQLEAELIIQADQVAAISRDPEGKYHVHTTHGGASTAGGAVWGGFWGLLFGLLFFIPFAGWAMGAGLGALFGHLGEKGIDKAFQQQVRDYLKPGTSALFMVIEHVTPDKAIAALEQYGGTVIKTSLSDEDTKKLQEALRPPAGVGAGS